MTAMPDARRLAARSVTLCKRLGLDDKHARDMVIKVASLVIQDLLGQGIRDVDWPYEVLLWARGMTPAEVASAVGELELEP